MKATDAVKLNEWIIENRGWLGSSERGTLAETAKRAARELGFHVTQGNLSELMRDNGMETRRMSAQQSEKLVRLAEIERLTAENQQLRRILGKVAASEYVPDDFKDFVFAGLDAEVKEAIFPQ